MRAIDVAGEKVVLFENGACRQRVEEGIWRVDVDVSAAISLKRIADVLDESLRTGHADGRSLHDILSSLEMSIRR